MASMKHCAMTCIYTLEKQMPLLLLVYNLEVTMKENIAYTSPPHHTHTHGPLTQKAYFQSSWLQALFDISAYHNQRSFESIRG